MVDINDNTAGIDTNVGMDTSDICTVIFIDLQITIIRYLTGLQIIHQSGEYQPCIEKIPSNKCQGFKTLDW